MKPLLIALLLTTTMTSTAQLKPVPSGVYVWNDLPVKKEPQRESRKIAEGTTNTREPCPGRHMHRMILKNSSSSKKANLHVLSGTDQPN
jgi:hypothetical protein